MTVPNSPICPLEPHCADLAREIARATVLEAIPSTLRDLIREAAREAVKETFLRMGLDPEKPTEAQDTFAFLRRFRASVDNISRGLTWAISAAVIAGLAAALAFYFGFRHGP